MGRETKGIRRAAVAHTNSGEEVVRQRKVNYTYLMQHLPTTSNRMDLGFLPIEEFSLDLLNGAANQVILLMRNGKFEVLPAKINTLGSIRDYVGVRFTRITHWSVLPVITGTNFPVNARINNIISINNDVYAHV